MRSFHPASQFFKLVGIEFSGRVCALPINGAVNRFVERQQFLVTEFPADTS